MSTKARWQANRLEFYDDQTHERVDPIAPVYFYDDFLCFQLNAAETGNPDVWETVEVDINAAVAVGADVANGVCSLALDADSNAQDAVLYFGDQRPFGVDQNLIFETRLTLSVLPTTGVCAVWGMVDDHNLDKDTVGVSAWFRLDASGALDVESDDTTNDNDDKTTGLTLVAGTYYIFRIDYTDTADVKFYVDGTRVSSGVTFDMSNMTAAEGHQQPYYSMDKASGTGVATMLIDYCRIWSDRA